MATWHCKELGDGVQAFHPTNRIIDAFMTMALAQAKAGCQILDAAVFSQSEPGASRVIVYFTPSAELLAKQFDAVPCSKPVPQTNFSLIAGDTRAWDAHFPDYRAKRPPIQSGRLLHANATIRLYMPMIPAILGHMLDRFDTSETIGILIGAVLIRPSHLGRILSQLCQGYNY